LGTNPAFCCTASMRSRISGGRSFRSGTGKRLMAVALIQGSRRNNGQRNAYSIDRPNNPGLEDETMLKDFPPQRLWQDDHFNSLVPDTPGRPPSLGTSPTLGALFAANFLAATLLPGAAVAGTGRGHPRQRPRRAQFLPDRPTDPAKDRTGGSRSRPPLGQPRPAAVLGAADRGTQPLPTRSNPASCARFARRGREANSYPFEEIYERSLG